MSILALIGGLLLILGTLWDAFETIVLPRRVTRSFRLTKLVYQLSWVPWLGTARHLRGRRRESFLSFYGPLVLLFLLIIWAVALVVGFGILQWAFGSALAVSHGTAGFTTDLYMSGTTFFTLGLGDVTPHSGLARVVTVVESGTGFGFLALVIGYLPVLYQAFSRREVNISLLDARAGSPSSAVELLRRHAQNHDTVDLVQFLRDWERWAAELLESHLSYPSLAYFRSQHENQSWVAALTTILDASALVMVGIDDIPAHPARLTFAIARHAAVDLTQVLNVPPDAPALPRLSPDDLVKVRNLLGAEGMSLRDGPVADKKLSELRDLYEPYVNALANRLLMPLPPWVPAADAADDWKTSAWE